jgi:hypothetical protein
MRPRLFFLSLLLFGLIFYSRGVFLGRYLEPRLEAKLTDLFGMPVTIDELNADPFTGTVRANRILFMNQDRFTSRPHLSAQLEGRIRYWELRDKHVNIDWIRLKRPFFLIEKILDDQGSAINIREWYRRIREKKQKKDEKQQAENQPEDPRKWRVTIGKIMIRNGMFVYDSRTKEDTKRQYVFRNLDGVLKNFKWRTEDPEELVQEVTMRGNFGRIDPAPFWTTSVFSMARP